MTQALTLLDAALEYVKSGKEIFPCHSFKDEKCTCGKSNCTRAAKHPIYDKELSLFNGVEHATTDEFLIKEWWNKYPHANIGWRLGEKSVAIDVDTKRNGMNNWLSVIVKELQPTDLLTYWQITPSGGYHYVFDSNSKQYTNSPGKLPSGIDVRGGNGYIIAAPSVGKSGSYTLTHNPETLLPLPGLIAKFLEEGKDELVNVVEEDTADYSILTSSERTRLSKYVSVAVSGELDKLKALGPNDEWDNITFKVCCKLVELANAPWNDYTTQQAARQVYKNAPKADGKGWDQDRVKGRFISAIKKVNGASKIYPVPKVITESLNTKSSSPPSNPGPPTGSKSALEQLQEMKEKASVLEVTNPSRPSYKMTSFSDIVYRPIEWYEEPWLPKVGIVGIAGPPGSGKSTYLSFEIAQLTNKFKLNCLYLSNKEEVNEGQVKGRLNNVGADQTKIWHMAMLDSTDQYTREITLRDNLFELEQAVKEKNIKAIYLDPGSSYIGIDEERASSSELRSALEELHAFAQKHQLLIRFLKHTKKDQTSSDKLPMISKVYGSGVWTEVCRVFPILWPISDTLREKLDFKPDDKCNVLLLRGKNNFAPVDLKSKAFYITKVNGNTIIEYLGDRDISGEDVVEKGSENKEETISRKDKTKSGIRCLEIMLHKAGKVGLPRRDIEKGWVTDNGCSWRTLLRQVEREELDWLEIIPVKGSNEKIWKYVKTENPEKSLDNEKLFGF